MEENQKAWDIYQLVRSQTKNTPDGRTKDIDQRAVIAVLKIHNWYNRKLFIQVVNLCRHMIGQGRNG